MQTAVNKKYNFFYLLIDKKSIIQFNKTFYDICDGKTIETIKNSVMNDGNYLNQYKFERCIYAL